MKSKSTVSKLKALDPNHFDIIVLPQNFICYFPKVSWSSLQTLKKFNDTFFAKVPKCTFLYCYFHSNSRMIDYLMA